MTAANGSGTYTWNTTGVAPGTYYIAGYLWDGSKPTYSHLKQTITIQAAAPPRQTFTMNGPTSGTYQVGQHGQHPVDGGRRRGRQHDQPLLRHRHSTSTATSTGSNSTR